MGHLKHPQSLISPSLVKFSNQWLHPMKPMKVSYISSSPRHNPLAKCLPSMINGRNGSMSTCRPGEVAEWAMPCNATITPRNLEGSLGFESQEPAKMHGCRAQVTSCHCVFGKTMLLSVVLCVKPIIDKSLNQSIWEAAIEHVNGISTVYRRCSHWNLPFVWRFPIAKFPLQKHQLRAADPNFWCVTYLWMLTTCSSMCETSIRHVGLTSGFRLIYMSDLKPDLRPW